MVSNTNKTKNKRTKQRYFSIKTTHLFKQENEFFVAEKDKKTKSISTELCRKCAFNITNETSGNCIKKEGCFSSDFPFTFFYKHLATQILRKKRF